MDRDFCRKQVSRRFVRVVELGGEKRKVTVHLPTLPSRKSPIGGTAKLSAAPPKFHGDGMDSYLGGVVALRC